MCGRERGRCREHKIRGEAEGAQLRGPRRVRGVCAGVFGAVAILEKPNSGGRGVRLPARILGGRPGVDGSTGTSCVSGAGIPALSSSRGYFGILTTAKINGKWLVSSVYSESPKCYAK